MMPLAQAATELWTPQFISSIVANLGVGTILAWHLWYTTSVAGPAKDKEHREAMAELAQQHEERLERLLADHRADRDAYRADLAAERTARQTEVHMLAERINCPMPPRHNPPVV